MNEGQITFEGLAREIGKNDGKAAASWVDLDEETAEAIERDGWGEVFADLSGPLSGEWADGYSVDALADDCGIAPPYDDSIDDLAAAYEDGYWQAFGDEIERKVEALRGPLVQVPLYGAVRVDGFPDHVEVAFRYVGQTFGGRARVVMVGDDQEWIVDAADLTHIDEDAFCHECGQIGCTADGRDRT